MLCEVIRLEEIMRGMSINREQKGSQNPVARLADFQRPSGRKS